MGKLARVYADSRRPIGCGGVLVSADDNYARLLAGAETEASRQFRAGLGDVPENAVRLRAYVAQTIARQSGVSAYELLRPPWFGSVCWSLTTALRPKQMLGSPSMGP